MNITTIKNILIFVVFAIGVHFTYEIIIRPEAQMLVDAAQQEGKTLPRNFFVLIKDIEQEICIILMFFGIYLIVAAILSLLAKRYLFNVDFLEDVDKGKVSGAKALGNFVDAKRDKQKALEQLEKLPKEISKSPLIQTLQASLRRYLITEDVQNTSDAITVSVENLSVQLETESSMIRYLIWAIPSIGFVGTVRGIGQALSDADKALSGDIGFMAESLGIAFNSTFIALLISLLLMFLLNQLQRIQDKSLLEIQAYCEKFLLNRISR